MFCWTKGRNDWCFLDFFHLLERNELPTSEVESVLKRMRWKAHALIYIYIYILAILNALTRLKEVCIGFLGKIQIPTYPSLCSVLLPPYMPRHTETLK